MILCAEFPKYEGPAGQPGRILHLALAQIDKEGLAANLQLRLKGGLKVPRAIRRSIFETIADQICRLPSAAMLAKINEQREKLGLRKIDEGDLL